MSRCRAAGAAAALFLGWICVCWVNLKAVQLGLAPVWEAAMIETSYIVAAVIILARVE